MLALVTCTFFASVASKSILDILAENSKLSTLHAAVSASKDVSELLSSPGHLTLFAPSNDAFLSYPMAGYKVKYLLDPVHRKNLAKLLSVSISTQSCKWWHILFLRQPYLLRSAKRQHVVSKKMHFWVNHTISCQHTNQYHVVNKKVESSSLENGGYKFWIRFVMPALLMWRCACFNLSYIVQPHTKVKTSQPSKARHS